MPRGKMPLKNCAFCGRDTKALDGVCVRCRGSSSGPRDGHQGRTGRRRTESLDEVEINREYQGRHNKYHGDTIRDDV